MDELLCHGSRAANLSSLFRSQSRALSVGTSEFVSDDISDGSESSQCCTSTRRIAIAKQILAEATYSFTPNLSIAAAKSAPK